MEEVKATRRIAQPADQAWQRVGNFGDLSWAVPGARVELSGEGVGATRTLTLEGGAQLRERLEAHDDSKRSYTYSLTEGPMPLSNYSSTVSVRDVDGQAEVTWQASFDAPAEAREELVRSLQEMYESALARLG